MLFPLLFLPSSSPHVHLLHKDPFTVEMFVFFLNFYTLFLLLQGLMLVTLLLLIFLPSSLTVFDLLIVFTIIFATSSTSTFSVCLPNFSHPMPAFRFSLLNPPSFHIDYLLIVVAVAMVLRLP